MFKLESYITPLILSRVEKYVKNVRTEDSQVSLWGGDVSLTNLDLRLDVLEEEFRLPFRLVSGHIHELQIHVPWTRLQSEPIVLTINTIECVLKLPNDGEEDARSGSASSGSLTSQDSTRKTRRSRGGEEAGAVSPPGYVQNLVNKILSNVQIVCNNLILKYVEDDLVLSVNVRHASLVSVDSKWEPAFTELLAPELILRKLLSVSDFTVCLDRRGPLGKIQVYEDPILYRCYLSVRISWLYRSLLNNTAYRTLFHLHADKLEFSITNKQVISEFLT
jgi:vacuolar protein sorting-associated protein 13B